MPNIINCPACQKAYSVDDAMMGKSMHCAGCLTPFIAGEKADVSDPEPAALTPPSVRFLCPSCSATLEIPEGTTSAACPDCATVTAVISPSPPTMSTPPTYPPAPQPSISVNLNYSQPRSPKVMLVGIGAVVVLALLIAGVFWRLNRSRTTEDVVVRNVEKAIEKVEAKDQSEREGQPASIREHRFWSSPITSHKAEYILHEIIGTDAGDSLYVERDGKMWRAKSPETYLDKPERAVLEFDADAGMTKRPTMDEASRLLLAELDRVAAKYGPGRSLSH